jgi:mRNA-degrading endonuclease HigB of HigAB toxin-antitoxin module
MPRKIRTLLTARFRNRVVYIRSVGTHRQYDAIDAQTI